MNIKILIFIQLSKNRIKMCFSLCLLRKKEEEEEEEEREALNIIGWIFYYFLIVWLSIVFLRSHCTSFAFVDLLYHSINRNRQGDRSYKWAAKKKAINHIFIFDFVVYFIIFLGQYVGRKCNRPQQNQGSALWKKQKKKYLEYL